MDGQEVPYFRSKSAKAKRAHGSAVGVDTVFVAFEHDLINIFLFGAIRLNHGLAEKDVYTVDPVGLLHSAKTTRHGRKKGWKHENACTGSGNRRRGYRMLDPLSPDKTWMERCCSAGTG